VAYELERHPRDLTLSSLDERGLVERAGADRGPLASHERAAPAAPAAAEAVRFEDVYEQHFEFVWRTLRLLGVQRGSIDDALQDTFGAIARQLPSFEGRSSMRTWVFGVAHKVAANHRRTHRRKAARLTPLDDSALSMELDPHARAEAREIGDLLVSFCEELDEGRRTVFVLGLLEDVPVGEIASLLGIPANTVYSRMRTLREGLRRKLEAREAKNG